MTVDDSDISSFISGTNETLDKRCAWLMDYNSSYNPNNVLIGNWCEERNKDPNQQNEIWPVYDGSNPLSSLTEYKEKYQGVRDISQEKIEEDWDTRFKEEEHFSILGRQEEYLKNMASSYDLHYRYCIKEKPNGEIVDTRKDSCLNHGTKVDYSLSYGNPTQFGLQKYKNFLWQQEENDKKYVRTTYQMSYGCPIKFQPDHHHKLGKASNSLYTTAENKWTYQGNTNATNHSISNYIPRTETGRRRAYLRCCQL